MLFIDLSMNSYDLYEPGHMCQLYIYIYIYMYICVSRRRLAAIRSRPSFVDVLGLCPCVLAHCLAQALAKLL